MNLLANYLAVAKTNNANLVANPLRAPRFEERESRERGRLYYHQLNMVRSTQSGTLKKTPGK